MNKLSFRARALDATKSLPIYYDHELPDSSDCTQNNRTVLQMPTGMEKEEESVSFETLKAPFAPPFCLLVSSCLWVRLVRCGPPMYCTRQVPVGSFRRNFFPAVGNSVS